MIDARYAQMSRGPVSIRSYRDGDEEGINDLHRLVNGRERGRREWEWEYRRAPAGPAKIWLAECDRRIVGHWSWIPFEMQGRTKRFLAGKSEALMVHPDQRGKGVAKRLVETALSSFADSGMHLIWTFPNDAALRILTRFGYVRVIQVPSVLLLNSPAKTLAVRAGFTKWGGRAISGPAAAIDAAWRRLQFRRTSGDRHSLHVQSINRFAEDFDQFWDDVGRQVGMTIARHSKFLNWRFADNPYIDYRCYAIAESGTVRGYVILYCQDEKGLRFGYISDIFVMPTDSVELVSALVSAALQFFDSQRADVVSCFCVDENHQQGVLRKVLRRHGPLLTHGGKHFIVRPGNPRSASEFTEANEWLVSEAFTEGVGA